MGRGCSLVSCFSGRHLIRERLPGCIAPTMSGQALKLHPVIHPDGRSTGHQVVTNCLALLAIGLIPTLMGLAGSIYFFTAFVVGIVFLGYGVRFAIFRSTVAARRLLLASYLYIPLQLGMMSFDKLPF